MRALWITICYLALPCLSFSAEETGKTSPAATAYQQSCAVCHGEKAEGNAKLFSPPIAGLPRWYLLLQMERYRDGTRGHHPDDIFGAQMAGVATGVEKKEIELISDYLAALPRTELEAPEKGDPKHGKELFIETCAECHRFNASGELAFKSAPLAAFPSWYLRLQFEKFKSGERGSNPKDEEGAKMKVVVAIPEITAHLDDILAYIAECQ